MSAENTSSSKARAKEFSPRFHAMVAGLMGLLAFFLFSLTSTVYVETSLSAPWLVQLLHLTPFPSMEYPVWSWIARRLAAINPAHFALILNLFSALCGAWAVALLYRLTESSLRGSEIRTALPALPIVSGVAAAAFLMLSIPFWIVSNRAHPASFDSLLLLGSLRLLQRYNDSSRRGWLFAFALLFGVGLAELGTFALILSPIAIHALYLLWKKRHLNVRNILIAIALGLAGLSLLFLAAWGYFRLPAAGWREAETYWDVLKYFLVDRRAIIMRSLPRHGWLLLGVSTLVPWVVMWIAQRRGRRLEVNSKLVFFYLLLFGIALAILFNLPIAPWRVLGTTPLLVTPYLFVASTFGLLFARAGVLLAAPILRRKRNPHWVIPVLAAFALIPLVLAGVRNVAPTATRTAGDMHRLTEAVLDAGKGRTLWVGDGLLASELSLEAYRRGETLDYVNAYQAEGFTYRRYVASLFKDERLQGLAMAGLSPLISSWIEQDEGALERLAIALRPDIWLGEGVEPVPMGILYLGAQDREALNPMETWQQNVAFWETISPILARLPTNLPPQQAFASGLHGKLGRVANDLGVFMEYTGHKSEAAQAYEKSLAFDPENLSAALNLLVIAGEVDPVPDVAAATALRDRELEKPVARPPRLLAIVYGHLRSAAAAALIAPGPGVGSSRQVDPELLEIQQLYQNGKLDEMRRRLERHLAVRSDQPEAWMLLAALGYREGQSELIERSLRQMKTVNQEWPYVLELMGRVRQQQGDVASAREFFKRALASRPNDLVLMQRLLDLEVAAGDWFNVEHLLNEILMVWPNNDDANFALANLLKARNRLDLAENILRRQIRSAPVPRAMAELADVLRMRGNYAEALDVATRAVAVLPQFARSHEVRGRILMDMGRMEEAEKDLTRARDLAPTSVSAAEALIDWYLANRNPDAASALASEVLNTAKMLTPEQDKALRKVAQ